MKQWSRWSLKAAVQQWDIFQNPHSCTWLSIDRINFDPKIQIKQEDTKHQFADILTKGNFTFDKWNNLLFCVTSAILVQFAALRMSALPVAPKRCRKGCHKEHTAASFSTVSSSSASNRMGIFRGPTQQGSNLTVSAGKLAAGGSKQNDAASGFSSVAKRCKNKRQCEETRCCKNEPGSEFSGMCKDTCSSRFRHRRRGRRLGVAEQFPRSNLYVDVGNVSDCHSVSRISVRKRYLGEPMFYQESATTNSETSVRCDKRSWSGIRKTSKEHPWSTGKNLRVLQFSIVHGQNQWKSRKRMEGENRLVCAFSQMWRIGSNRRGADGVRVDFSRIHYIADFRRDLRTW